MTHSQALDSAVEAFALALEYRFFPVPDDVITAFKDALEHYRIARGEDDGDE